MYLLKDYVVILCCAAPLSTETVYMYIMRLHDNRQLNSEYRRQ